MTLWTLFTRYSVNQSHKSHLLTLSAIIRLLLLTQSFFPRRYPLLYPQRTLLRIRSTAGAREESAEARWSGNCTGSGRRPGRSLSSWASSCYAGSPSSLGKGMIRHNDVEMKTKKTTLKMMMMMMMITMTSTTTRTRTTTKDGPIPP